MEKRCRREEKKERRVEERKAYSLKGRDVGSDEKEICTKSL